MDNEQAYEPPKRGKVVASYLVRVTLRQRPGSQAEATVPTVADVERRLGQSVASWDNELTAHVSAERVDR